MASAGDIITFLGLAYKAVQYFEGVRHAPKERDVLLNHISSLCNFLEELKSINLLMTMDLSKGNQKEVWGLVDQLGPKLQLLRQDLGQKPKLWKEIFIRVRWPTKKTEFQENLAYLEKLVVNIKRFQDVATSKKLAWDRVRKWITPTILDKVVDTSYVRDIAKGTGEDLLHSNKFKDWRSKNNGGFGVMGSGSGKTGQIKVIQRYFEKQKGNLDDQVAVVYCAQKMLCDLEDPMEIIMSFWAQLDAIRGKSEIDLPEGLLEELIDNHKIDGLSTLPGEEAIKLKMDIICHHIANSRPTILILDGLDEVPTKVFGTLQRHIVENLMEIQKRTGKCRLLITSRPYDSIRRIFYPTSPPSTRSTVFNYQLKPGKLEIEKYVMGQIDEHKWPLRHANDGELVRLVINTLVPKCNVEESFLLAKLYMDQIIKTIRPHELDRVLENLPQDVNEAYEEGLSRLAEECAKPSDELPCIAIQALYWVIWAKRPLKSEELEQVLAVGVDESGIETKPCGSASIGPGIDSFCGQLVVIDPSTGRVSVEHKTLIEYLELPKTQSTWWQNRSVSQYMALILMKYLSRKNLKEPPVTDTDCFKTQYLLIDYALHHWGDYLQNLEADSETYEQVIRFLTRVSQEWNEHVDKKARDVVADKHPWTRRNGNDALASGTLSPLHWAVHFDLEILIPRLAKCQSQSPSKPMVPIGPLGMAVSHRLNGVKRLLECGIDVNDYEPINRSRRPPLYDAVYHEEETSVQLLLDAGAQWTVKREDNDQSALHLLYYDLGQVQMARLAVNTMRERGELATAEGLQLLIKGRFTEELRTAIGEGLDVNQPCDNGKRALDYAYELRDTDAIKLLKDHGATAKLVWPAFRPGQSSTDQNFPDIQPDCAVIIKEATTFQTETCSQPDVPWQSTHEQILLDVKIDETFELPVRSLVFETRSCDQGWSSHEGKETYLGSGHGCSFFVRIRNDQKSSIFDLQHNVHASETPRLHTNVWNISDLHRSFPARAQCMRAMQTGTSLQIVSRDKGAGWRNNVHFVRIRIYGKEVNL